MRPNETGAEEVENAAPVAGDVIGDTAYSERFVLKILLKLANRDTLKDELLEQSFEEQLCTLWDMAAERDVVLYLQRHDVLNLFTFAMPVIESVRIIEIIIGIIGNMCCHKEAVDAVLANDELIVLLLDYLKSDDSQILNQLLRLISSCLFLANEDDIGNWMTMFDNIGYAELLYFILKNSTNKELLITALENFNTLCTQCNIGKYSHNFFEMFVHTAALDAVYAGYREVTKHATHEDDQGRIQVITLQITMHLVGFNRSPEIYSLNRSTAVRMVRDILASYEHSITVLRKIDDDLVDILDSANTVVSMLHTSEMSNPDKYFNICYKMWKVVMSVPYANGPDFEENRDRLKEFFKTLRVPLSTLMCTYMSECLDDNLLKILDKIGNDYENIINDIADVGLRTKIMNRAVNYRNRLNENIDS